jgi:hypothetical protein
LITNPSFGNNATEFAQVILRGESSDGRIGIEEFLAAVCAFVDTNSQLPLTRNVRLDRKLARSTPLFKALHDCKE